MVDWTELTLFLYITARMSGFILFNPILGRRTIPGIFRSGFILALSFFAISSADRNITIPANLPQLVIELLLELALGLLLGMVVNFFFYIPQLAGSTIDMQMGMSMGATYDPGSGAQVTITSTMLNLLMSLLFFTANGHHTLIRIMVASGGIVPFGAVVLGEELYMALIEVFIDCTILGIKLCMPILAAELLGQVGMGILMKVIPQINVFAINIELKVIIGLSLTLLLMVPFSEFLLDAETEMLLTLQRLLPLMSG